MGGLSRYRHHGLPGWRPIAIMPAMSDLFNDTPSSPNRYSAHDIEVLEGLEPVRRRPGMYIGGTDERALHHLVAEILDNAMDEAVAGYANRIDLELGADGIVTVRDNGRGIPVDEHPKYPGTSALEVILTTLHSGGKFGGKVYATSGGLHGVGLSVVNALSDMLSVEVARDRQLWVQDYSRGRPQGPLALRGSTPNRRGTTIRLTDLSGDACAHLLLLRAGEPWERLNVADTVKVQWNAYLGVGQLLLSDQGRVLATIVTDTAGRHDTLCGTSSRLRNEHRYGSGWPGGPSPAGRELFVLAAAKHGLGPADLPPGISFFKGVRVEPDTGDLTWTGAAPAPSHVELRAELDLVVLIVNTAHPLDPRPDWSCTTLEVLAWPGEPTALDQWPATASPEAARAFANNDEDLSARGRGPSGTAT